MRPANVEITEMIDWDEVHRAIQAVLDALDDRVARLEPSVCRRVGRTSGRSFPLFSYREFARSDSEDRVIVGITVQDREDRFRISGEIAGEESGQIHLDGGTEADVPRTLRAVLGAVGRIARRLAPCDRAVIDALGGVAGERPAIGVPE